MVTGPLHDPCGGHPALDFVNTVDRTLGKPWVDRLTGYSDLAAWSALAGTLPKRDAAALERQGRGSPSKGAHVLKRARELREALYRILAAPTDGSDALPADLAVLNSELARALAHLRLESGTGGFAWSWERSAALDLPLWPVVQSAAELLISPERALVKRCAGSTCLWLFLDRTKNHARRWCDMKVCGNRAKVRRHRRRRASGDPARPE